MINISKYRKLSVVAIAMMVIIFILCLAALWNSLLGSEVKHAGWIATFIILLFALGVFLFLLAYRFTDVSKLEESRKRAYDEGKKLQRYARISLELSVGHFPETPFHDFPQ